MAAPEFKITQALPSCAVPTTGQAPFESNTNNGPIRIHASCCRSLGRFVNVANRPLAIHESFSGCDVTDYGEREYSSDSFAICSQPAAPTWDIVFPDDPSPIGGNPWVGGNIFLEVAGPCGGSDVGNTVNIANEGDFAVSAGVFQSAFLALGCFAGGVTVTPLFNGGSNRRFRIAFPDSATAPTAIGFGSEWWVNDSEAQETAPISIVGPFTSGGQVRAYYDLTWTHCNRGGIVLRVRNADGDAVIATYSNLYYAVLHGRHTILNRVSVACDHPCKDRLTPAQLRGLHPPALCFHANNQNPCLGGPMATSYSLAVTGAGSTDITEWAFGATGSAAFPNSLGEVAVPIETPADTIEFELNGDLVDSAGEVVLENAGISGTFKHTGGVGEALVRPCTLGFFSPSYPGRRLNGRITGAMGPDLEGPNEITISHESLPGGSVTIAANGISFWAELFSDELEPLPSYCSGSINLNNLEPISDGGGSVIAFHFSGATWYMLDTGFSLMVWHNGLIS